MENRRLNAGVEKLSRRVGRKVQRYDSKTRARSAQGCAFIDEGLKSDVFFHHFFDSRSSSGFQDLLECGGCLGRTKADQSVGLAVVVIITHVEYARTATSTA